MNRLLVGLILLCAPVITRAQAAYQFVNYKAIPNGFQSTFLFRNTNGYGDPTIVALGPVVHVATSARVQTLCATVAYCGVNNMSGMYYVGNVQHEEFFAGNFPYPWFPEYSYEPVTCIFWNCTAMLFQQNTYAKVLGCQVPETSSFFTGRTCDADGYSGWLAYDVRFTFGLGLNDDPNMLIPAFDVSDWSASFTELELSGPNVMVATVPEPSTVAMLGLGLVVAFLGARRRRMTVCAASSSSPVSI